MKDEYLKESQDKVDDLSTVLPKVQVELNEKGQTMEFRNSLTKDVAFEKRKPRSKPKDINLEQ